MRRLLPTSLTFALLLSWQPAQAQIALPVHEVGEDGVRIDGMLRDWRTIRRVRVGRGDDASMSFALGYDARGLYVAAEVSDERLVRTRRPTPNEDAIVVTLATPRGRGWQASEVWVFAGKPPIAGSAAVGTLGARRLRPANGSRVVEAPRDGGYSVEAFVPWSRIPGASRWQEGRISVRLRDVDLESRPEVEDEPATAEVDPRNLDRLPRVRPTGGEAAVLDRFLQAQGIPGADPDHSLRGDVCGDGRPERVVQVQRFVVVFGAGYEDGNGFDFLQLPVQATGDVHGARLRDFTGDGKAELLVELRQRDGRGSRDLWQLFTFDCDRIRPLFAVETRKETPRGHVEASVRVTGRGRRTQIEVRAGRAHQLSPESFREAAATDAEAILLPWGPVLQRTYRWDGERFATVRERANPNPWDPAAEQRERERERQRERERDETPAQSAPGIDDLLAAVRRERRIPPSVRPRFRADVNLAEDGAPERLVVLGDALVVVGTRFRRGQGYFHFEIPVAAHADLLDVSTADLTGDGRHEVLIRARQALGDVQRELLMVHRFTRGGGFPRILSVEVARQQQDHRVENEVRTRGGRLEIRPGRARGWSAETWPWSATADTDVAPLLLPWRDRPVRYRFADDRLLPR